MTAHIPALDGLRGIAILLVLFHHLTIARPATPSDGGLFSLFHMGWMGVDLFLVLSGFLITGILLDMRHQPRFFTRFYARRTLRIFPLYYLMIVISYFILPLFPVWYARLVGQGFVPPAYVFFLFLSNFTMAKYDDILHGILGVSWSLAIEEQFYLIWAPIVRLVSPAWLGPLCAAIVVATPLLRTAAINGGASEIEIYVLTMYRADALAAGGWLAWMARRPSWPTLHKFGPWALLAGVLGLAALIFRDSHMSWDGGLKQMVGYSALAVAGSGSVLVATNPTPGAIGPRVLAAGWLRMFGRYSYCLYLIHLPVMWAVRYTVFDPNRMTVYDSALLPQILFWLLAGTPAVLLAALSYRYVELPFLRLKRFFSH